MKNWITALFIILISATMFTAVVSCGDDDDDDDDDDSHAQEDWCDDVFQCYGGYFNCISNVSDLSDMDAFQACVDDTFDCKENSGDTCYDTGDMLGCYEAKCGWPENCFNSCDQDVTSCLNNADPTQPSAIRACYDNYEACTASCF